MDIRSRAAQVRFNYSPMELWPQASHVKNTLRLELKQCPVVTDYILPLLDIHPMKTSRCRILRRIPLFILSLWVFGTFTACRQKELLYSGEPVKVMVDFDWQMAEDADPEGMTLVFFPADSCSKLWRFDIPGREGGEVELLSGRYNVIAYNSDLPGIGFTDKDSYDRYSAIALNKNDSAAAPSGMLYAAHLSPALVFDNDGSSPVISLSPDSLSTVYHIRLDSVSGTERIKTATALLRGIARSVCLRLQCNSIESCAISAPLIISPENRSVLETVTTGFGNPDIPDPRIELEVAVTTSHGKYRKTFDVTDQVMNSKYPRNVDINITGLDIPAADTPVNPGGDDVGISVGVDGWQVIEITYS